MNTLVSPETIDLAREPNFNLGAIEVRPATREVIANSQRDVLEPRVMQVLVALSRRRDEVISRDELIMSCWAGRMVGDDAINRCIGRIRRLSETHGGFRLETIPRVGYRLTEMSSPPSQDDAATPTERPAQSIGRDARGAAWFAWFARHARAVGLVAFVLLIVTGGTAYWLSHRPAAEARLPAKFTIAVLPFNPPPGDRQAEQLADAVSTSIADALSSEGFEVVSPARTRQFRGASKAGAAQALHADFLIDGEIRREGDTIKVSVRVIEGSSATTLISDTVEAAANKADVLPESVAIAVSNYGWNLTPGLDPSVPLDLHVMAGGLKAANLLEYRHDPIGATNTARLLAAFAPGNSYAQLLHGLAAAAFVRNVPPDLQMIILGEARGAAKATLQLDPLYGDAYAVLSRATPTFNWAVREGYLRQGLRLRAMSSIAYMDLLEFFMNAGYIRLAARLADETFSSHPHYGSTMVRAINGRLWLGDVAGARTLIARGQKFFPTSPWFPAKMFEATAFNGQFADAEALLRDQKIALLPGRQSEIYDLTLAALRYHRPTDVQAVADRCRDLRGRPPELWRTCFIALVRLEQLDQAFRLAEFLYPDQRGRTPAEIERRWLSAPSFATAYLVAPVTAPLRADPRYRDVVERVGLLQYWKAAHHPPDFCAVEKARVCAELES